MSRAPVGQSLAVAAALVVLATVIAAIATMGSPSTQREIRFDERRVDDLRRIADAIDNHAERRAGLPPELATLASEPGRDLAIVDPVHGAPYGYEVVGDDRYRLCAVFTTDTGQTPHGARLGVGDEWLHGRGRHCFDRKIDHETPQ